MKNFYKYMSMALLVSTLVIGCKKNTDEFVPYNNSDFNDTEWSNAGISNQKREAMVNGISKPTVSLDFDATATSVQNISSFSKLGLPANATTLNGNNYTGTITAKLKELVTKGDFVRNLIPSCSSNNLQETNAAYNLDLKSNNGSSLSIKNTSKVDASFNDGSSTILGYDYYYGSLNNNLMSWNMADSNKGKLNYAPINGILHYQIKTNTQGWMQINKALNLNNSATTSIVTNTNFTNKNTTVFAVLKNYKTVIQLQSNTTNKVFFDNKLPVNEPVTYVAISYLDGKYYMGFNENVVTNDAQIKINTSTNSISILTLNTFLDSL